MAFKGTQVLIPAAATTLATLLSLPNDLSSRTCRQLVLRIASTSTGPMAVGSTSAVTAAPLNAAAVLLAADTYPTIFGAGSEPLISLDNVWVIGTATAGDILHIAYIS
jgi:hypothetical protein